jgi:uncharacterized protein YjbI with pentapeptide repeats
MKTMTVGELMARYNAGERDFSGIVMMDASLSGMDLSGAILRNANLSYSSFRDAKLNGTDLTGANVEMSDFTRADLRDANMTKVRAVWSKFNDAHFGNTILVGANLSNAIFFRADLYGGADLTNANMTNARLRPEELTQQDIIQFKMKLGSLEGVLEQDTLYYLQMMAQAAAEKVNAGTAASEPSPYDAGGVANVSVGYSMKAGGASLTYGVSAGSRLGVYGMQ